MPSDEEIKKCKTLSHLISKPGIKKDWQTSVALEPRTSRLAFQCKYNQIIFCFVTVIANIKTSSPK